MHIFNIFTFSSFPSSRYFLFSFFIFLSSFLCLRTFFLSSSHFPSFIPSQAISHTHTHTLSLSLPLSTLSLFHALSLLSLSSLSLHLSLFFSSSSFHHSPIFLASRLIQRWPCAILPPASLPHLHQQREQAVCALCGGHVEWQ